jgi:hypothetical protein
LLPWISMAIVLSRSVTFLLARYAIDGVDFSHSMPHRGLSKDEAQQAANFDRASLCSNGPAATIACLDYTWELPFTRWSSPTEVAPESRGVY